MLGKFKFGSRRLNIRPILSVAQWVPGLSRG